MHSSKCGNSHEDTTAKCHIEGNNRYRTDKNISQEKTLHSIPSDSYKRLEPHENFGWGSVSAFS
jgi:hypothetical protein